MVLRTRDARVNAIEIAGVSKTFPADYDFVGWLRRGGRAAPRRVALDDVALAVDRGEVFGLLGPNGAGKTTLLKSIATLLVPDRGRIAIEGIDTVADPIAAKRKIGLSLGEERSFYHRLSARENLEFFGALVGVARERLARRIGEVARIVDLVADLDRDVRTYSSGMRARLGVARALLADPEIVIFDEPTRAVDPVRALEIRYLIRTTLSSELGKTVVLSTNVLDEAWAVCDRVAILRGGSVVALGAPAVLAARFAGRRRFAITFDALDDAHAAAIAALPGIEEATFSRRGDETLALVTIDLFGRNLTGLLATISANGHTVRGMRDLDDSLFDVFRAATGRADGPATGRADA
ncbi:MAG: ABC transporter ATP-binding protein [Vulcanimicrobiaceae bacterium]